MNVDRLSSWFAMWMVTEFSRMVFAASRNPTKSLPSLKGRNLVITGVPSATALFVKRNSLGFIVEIDGVSKMMLDWLSEKFKFTFSFLQSNDSALDPSDSSPGLISYVLNKKCDLIIGTVATTEFRASVLSFPHFFSEAPVSFLIPKPNSLVNLSAVADPFDRRVWISLFGAITALILTVLFFNWMAKNEVVKVGIHDNYLPNATLYVISVLLNQGGYCSSKRPAIRIVAATWCLATFVLVNSYSSLLISYVTSPNEKPLIRSVYEIPYRPELRIVLDKGASIDAVLSSADRGIMKSLGKMLQADPELSRCSSISQCLQKLKSGFHVYIGAITYLRRGIQMNYQATRQCNLQMGNERFVSLQLCWGVPKKSPIMEHINQGILKMRENGLLDFWKSKFLAVGNFCDGKIKKSTKNSKLSFKNLTGAFIVLLAGFVMSVLSFICEICISRYR